MSEHLYRKVFDAIIEALEAFNLDDNDMSIVVSLRIKDKYNILYGSDIEEHSNMIQSYLNTRRQKSLFPEFNYSQKLPLIFVICVDAAGQEKFLQPGAIYLVKRMFETPFGVSLVVSELDGSPINQGFDSARFQRHFYQN